MGFNCLVVMGGQVSSCGGGLLSIGDAQGFSSIFAMFSEVLLQMWYVGSSLDVASCTSLIVCGCSSLVVI